MATKKTASENPPRKTAPANRTRRAPSTSPRPARQKPTGTAVAGSAARQLLELTGREAEGVTGLEKTEEGWRVQVEVVEVRRIPDTTDVLALYEIDVDSDGDLVGYRRLRRYGRGVPGEG